MPIDKKKIMLGAVVAGLIAGSGAAMAMGKSPERSDTATAGDTTKTESKDTHSCGGPNGCPGK